jgi:hypothetical protein
MSNYGPSFKAANLYRKTSAKGATYFVGRMGGVKVALLKSSHTADNGDEIWSLMLSEAQPYQPRDDAKAQSQAPQPTPSEAPRGYDRASGPDDEIPF